MRKEYSLNLRGENDMSKKHGTDELVEYLWQLVTVSTNHSEGRDVDIGKMSVIVSKLKVADKLCEDVKHGIEVTDDERIARPFVKAIAEYKGKE